MQKLGLTHAERSAYHKALRSDHVRRFKVRLLDLNGNLQADLSDRLLDGEVIVDGKAEVTRSLTLSLIDRKHSLGFDTDSPDDTAIYADRMLQVVYSVYVDSLARHVNVTIFTGPVTNLDRQGEVLELEAQGKESLAMGAMWRPLVLKKGLRKMAGIRTILAERAGETRFDMPDRDDRLKKTQSYDRYAKPWKAATHLAKSEDLQLFYDGRGVAVVRHLPETPIWTFRTGTGKDIVKPVEVAYTMEDVVNTIVVKGGKPKGAKENIQEIAVADGKLSPRRLGRDIPDPDTPGQTIRVPRHLPEVIEAGHIDTHKKARAKAERVLRDRLRSVVDISFDALVLPHIDPGDLFQVEGVEGDFRIWQYTIPLAADGDPTMAVGYTKNTHRRRRRKHKP